MAVPGPNVREGHKKKETDNPDKMGRASGAWMDKKQIQKVVQTENIYLPPPSCIVILGRQPSLSKPWLFLVPPWRRVKHSVVQSHVCDLRLAMIASFCAWCYQTFLVPLLTLAHRPIFLPPYWLPATLHSGSQVSLLAWSLLFQ
jgi:hypothetical protein